MSQLAHRKTKIAEEEECAILELLVDLEEDREKKLEELWRGPSYRKKFIIDDIVKYRGKLDEEGKEAD